ncbi:MAG: exopolysaccharide biosynthesis polyprenyl glycosylphosphotransferase [Patescibacteria group bacterium]|nr:exopolysaccharide biosynthesis polyprenyl glycosylphosphotransferase [Patescibacteria group bacterium]
MKKAELAFNLLSVPMDAVMLLLAGITAFYLRLHSVSLVGPIKYDLQLREFLLTAIKVLPVLVLIFAVLGLYNLRGARNFAKEFSGVIIGNSIGLLVVLLLFFFNTDFNQSVFPSRFIILATWGFGIVFIMFGRMLLRLLQRWFFALGLGLHKLVIIEGEKNEAKAIREVYRHRKYGYRVAAEIRYSGSTLPRLEELFQRRQIDEILQANADLLYDDNLKLVAFARSKGLDFSFVPNLFEVQRNVVETYSLNGVPVISLKNTPLDGWGKVAKRALDIVVSLACLILTSPLFLLIAIVVKLDSPGRVIYAAKRGGQGRDFNFFKFRTMYSHLSVGSDYGGQEAEKVRRELWKVNSRGGQNGPFLKIKHDPRVTRVGKFLRKTKLDEIPQFWNVLKGDMSMVGPRAHVLDEVQRYKDRYPRMFSIKPGTFGVSQIAQLSWPDLPFEEEIRLNIFYIENWSLWLDVKILAKSFWLLLFGVKPKEDY